ncbi:hypothetical protein PMIN01_06384 [Paraphaeosphaeria minitans]|uniref:Uncharacterized protein n=1 Tax=Paraphaeosphaeria minitans TaxID=565426 RepID=A0A9P6KQW6_9PLEO|nr:hypothetical protein PMIN01_06384 [Paraphaeosphaeria minitans]
MMMYGYYKGLNLGWEFLDLLKRLRSKGEDSLHPYALQFTLARAVLRPGQDPAKQSFKLDGRREEDAADFCRTLINYLREIWYHKDEFEPLAKLFHFAISDVFTNTETRVEIAIKPVGGWDLLLYLHDSLGTTVADAMTEAAEISILTVIDLLEHNSTYYAGGFAEGIETGKQQKRWRFTATPDFLMLTFCRQEVVEGKSKETAGNSSRLKLA